MSRVFAPQQPMRYNRDQGGMVPSMDLTPAMEYGDLIIMIPYVGADALLLTVPVVRKIREAMRDFSRGRSRSPGPSPRR